MVEREEVDSAGEEVEEEVQVKRKIVFKPTTNVFGRWLRSIVRGGSDTVLILIMTLISFVTYKGDKEDMATLKALMILAVMLFFLSNFVDTEEEQNAQDAIS